MLHTIAYILVSQTSRLIRDSIYICVFLVISGYIFKYSPVLVSSIAYTMIDSTMAFEDNVHEVTLKLILFIFVISADYYCMKGLLVTVMP